LCVCVVCFKGYGAKAGTSNGQGANPNGKYHVIITCFGSKI